MVITGPNFKNRYVDKNHLPNNRVSIKIPIGFFLILFGVFISVEAFESFVDPVISSGLYLITALGTNEVVLIAGMCINCFKTRMKYHLRS